MPIEVSPAPFRRSMQLPYTPMFVPETIPQPGTGESMPNGPGSVAASAIIPPNPGGIASPHHAIPALAEAGYTAPTIRPASMLLDPGGQGGYPTARSIIRAPSAGASLYEPQSPRLPPPNPGMGPLAHMHAEGWTTASLPAPRPAPRLQTADLSPIATSGHHSPHHHHPHHHHHHHESVVDDDGMSDASYYARPKMTRHRSGSASSFSSGASSPREPRHRRAGSLGHHARLERDELRAAAGHHRSPSLQPGQQGFSPISPSPLSLASGPRGRGHSHSPLSPVRSRHESGARRHEDRPREDKTRSHVDASYHSETPAASPHDRGGDPDLLGLRNLHIDISAQRGRKGSNFAPSDAGDRLAHSRDRSRERSRNFRDDPREPERAERKSPSQHHDDHRDHRERKESRVDHGDKRPEERRPRPASIANEGAYDRRDRAAYHAGDDDRTTRRTQEYEQPRGGSTSVAGHHSPHARQHRHDPSHHHHRHHSSAHLAPPAPLSESMEAPRRRTHSHAHSQHLEPYRAPSPPPTILAGGHPHDYKDPYRRRAVSMQFDQGPMGGLYQAPSVAGGLGAEGLYDDGASIAGSGMTFMDGPIGGRTSQYGIPKYMAPMKPDPRRFMIQRGKADVYLD